MQQEGEHAVLVALPTGNSSYETMCQQQALIDGFISYLGGKQAAGIVNVTAPGAQTVSDTTGSAVLSTGTFVNDRNNMKTTIYFTEILA